MIFYMIYYDFFKIASGGDLSRLENSGGKKSIFISGGDVFQPR
jgi:hypothetical protein